MSDAERKLLLDLLLGNVAAAQFCEDILFIAHVWDDQIDRDNARGDHDVDTAWTKALIDIPRNPFYRAHFDLLSPIMAMAINHWRASRAYEADPKACLTRLGVAFTIRSSYMDVLIMCAMIVGGHDYGLDAEFKLREIFHREGLRAYRDKLKGMRHV